jgi:ribosomal protein L21
MKYVVSTLAALTLLAFASPPAAQAQSAYPRWETAPAYYYSGGYYTPNRGWYYDYYHNPNSQRTQGQQLRGEILRTKNVEIQGTNQDILAALVQTTDGRRVVADLGPVDRLEAQGLTPQQGEQIMARGRMTRIGEHPVFVAQQLSAGGHTLTINRRQQPSRQWLQEEEQMLLGSRSGQGEYGEEYSGRGSRFSRSQGYEEGQGQEWQEHQLRGQIQSTKWVQLPGLQHQMLAALVRTDGGRQWLVNLGTEAELEHLSLHKGDRISVRGRSFFISGQPVLLAEQVRAHGQTAAIEQAQETPLSTQQVRGQIVRTQQIQLPGLRSPVEVALVKADNGRRWLVALGTEQDMENVQLNKGDQVSIRGPVLQVGNRRFLIGQQLRAHGETVQLNQQEQMTRRAYEQDEE